MLFYIDENSWNKMGSRKEQHMTYLDITAFLEVIKAGSFSGAAEVLYITQPALSRRIMFLEHEVGCTLFYRGKGIRQAQLTTAGKAFVPIAERLRSAWEDALNISRVRPDSELRIATVSSVGAYILFPVIRDFLTVNAHTKVSLYTYHSLEAYQYVEARIIDLGFVANKKHSREIQTIPAFSEPMMLVTNDSMTEDASPETLDPAMEIRLPWSTEYDIWHDYWFGAKSKPKAYIDQMGMMESFLEMDNTWAIMPASAAKSLASKGKLYARKMQDGPPDRMIYYICAKHHKEKMIQSLLDRLKEELNNLSGE